MNASKRKQTPRTKPGGAARSPWTPGRKKGALREAPGVLLNLCSLQPGFLVGSSPTLAPQRNVVSVRSVTGAAYPTKPKALTSILSYTHRQCSTGAKTTCPVCLS